MKMLEPIRTKRVGSVTIKIVPDDSGAMECPLDGLTDADGFKFVTFERGSTLSDYHNFDNPEQAKAWAKQNRYDLFPLFRYEHGLVAYSTKSFIGRAHHAEWDSGQVGFVLLKKSIYRKVKSRPEIAESWCKAVTTWVNGEYYGFVIEDEEGEHLDSCWGFDDADYCEAEAMAAAKHYAKKLQDEKFAENLNEHGTVQ